MALLQFLTLALLAHPFNPSAEPSRLLELVKERAKIRSGEFIIRVHFKKCEIQTILSGRDFDTHYWFDLSSGAVRVDRVRPAEQDGRVAAKTSRYAFDGTTHRIMDSAEELYPLREYDKRTLLKAHAAPELIDARLIGLFMDSFLGVHNFTLNDVSRIATDAESWNREETAHGGFKEVYRHKKGLTYEYEFASNGDIVKATVISIDGLGIRFEAELSYDAQRRDAFRFPASIDFKRLEHGALTLHEIWSIEVIQINQPIDRSLLTWEGLKPKPGASLVVNHDYQHVSKRWTKAGFVPYVEQPPITSGPSGSNTIPRSGDGHRWWIIAASVASAILGLALLYRIAIRFKTPAGQH